MGEKDQIDPVCPDQNLVVSPAGKMTDKSESPNPVGAAVDEQKKKSWIFERKSQARENVQRCIHILVAMHI